MSKAGAGGQTVRVLLAEDPLEHGDQLSELVPGPSRVTLFREGCSSFEVVNLFALVSTDPRWLLIDPDPVGFACDQVIVIACTGHDDRTVVVAWGANAGHPRPRPRALQVLELLDRHQVPCRVLGITADGHLAPPAAAAQERTAAAQDPARAASGEPAPWAQEPGRADPSIAGQGVSESPGSRAAGAA